MRYLVIYCFLLLAFSANAQTNKAKYTSLYLHKVVVLDANGNKLDTDWEVGVNAYMRYTHITVKDTQNIIVTIDKNSEFIIFYKKEIKFTIAINQLILCKKKQKPDEVFSANYEYNLYIQLSNNCNTPFYSVGLNGLGFDCRKIKNFNFGNSEPTIEEINHLPACDCGNKIFFYGNLDTKNKLKRKYILLDSKLR